MLILKSIKKKSQWTSRQNEPAKRNLSVAQLFNITGTILRAITAGQTRAGRFHYHSI